MILPVIHTETLPQALRNVDRATVSGADGVFLINHSISPADLLSIVRIIQRGRQNVWVGANFLGLRSPHHLKQFAQGLSGLWMDGHPTSDMGVEALTFGGVAFKHQRWASLEDDVRKAAPYVDVLVTSGPRTGTPPDVLKVRRLRELAGDQPIGIASGLDIDNVGLFAPLVDYMLVATGVSESFTELDPILLRDFVQKASECRAP